MERIQTQQNGGSQVLSELDKEILRVVRETGYFYGDRLDARMLAAQFAILQAQSGIEPENQDS